METFKSFEEVLYNVNEGSFNEIAISLFHFQADANPVYKEYLHHLGVSAGKITELKKIPFLPISFFKTHAIKTGDWKEEAIFISSGTGGSSTSHHHVRQMSFYQENATRCFSYFFGDPRNYHFLALLPAYLERKGSSLIEMVRYFIGDDQIGGFYLSDTDALITRLIELKSSKKKVILWGVSFALLDLAEKVELDLSHCIVIETGGMKGRRKEVTREELHDTLTRRFKLTAIHGEFGMTELLSQAYASKQGHFGCPPWMKILLRDPEDPLELAPDRMTGGLNVIDLANFHSCAFIETQDLGRRGQNGNFEVLGRLDNSDIRGCNLLVE